jgi:hypothetical protein
MPGVRRPQRLFLDAGVVIQAFVAEWGAPKALLVLATMRESFTIVLAQQIEREVRRAFARRIGTAQPNERLAAERRLAASFDGWLARITLERLDAPTPAVVYDQLGVILPALRHTNDLEAVVSAMLARPDWVISTNTDHWGSALATRTGLRIGTPLAFLEDVARTYADHAAG